MNITIYRAAIASYTAFIIIGSEDMVTYHIFLPYELLKNCCLKMQWYSTMRGDVMLSKSPGPNCWLQGRRGVNRAGHSPTTDRIFPTTTFNMHLLFNKFRYNVPITGELNTKAILLYYKKYVRRYIKVEVCKWAVVSDRLLTVAGFCFSIDLQFNKVNHSIVSNC